MNLAGSGGNEIQPEEGSRENKGNKISLDNYFKEFHYKWEENSGKGEGYRIKRRAYKMVSYQACWITEGMIQQRCKHCGYSRERGTFRS